VAEKNGMFDAMAFTGKLYGGGKKKGKKGKKKKKKKK